MVDMPPTKQFNQKSTAQPLVSVVMPVRDAAATLAEALQSLRAQRLEDWELIVVDDGSADETAVLLQQAACADARVQVLTRPARGIAVALQTACREARAPFIARMDADDWMHPSRLAEQVAYLLAQPETGLVSCQVAFGGTAAGYAAHVDWLNQLMTPEAMSLRRFVEAPVAHPSVMFRRALLDEHGGYRAGSFPEDYELWLRWLEAGVRFAKLPTELLRWNDLPTRLSRTDPRYAVAAFFDMKAAYLARWLAREVPPQRALWLWGAGRVTRRRFSALAGHGVRLCGYVDVDPAKTGRELGGLPVRGFQALPERERSFILVGVGARGARELICQHLEAEGWREGQDYLLVA
jgi:glycosyltransferase involved in cell wall biosynthesis